jgi:two-component sensor histidine kinase
MVSFHDIMLVLIPISILFSLTGGIYQWVRYKNALSRWGGLTILGVVLNLSCYYLLFSQVLPTLGRALVFLQVAGFLLVDVGYLMFITYFTGRSRWVTKLSVAILAVVPILVIILMAFQWSALPSVLKSNPAGFGFNIEDIRAHPMGFDILFIGFSQLSGMLSVSLLVWMYFSSPGHYHKTILGMLTGTLLAALAGTIDIFGINPFSDASVFQFALAFNAIPIFLTTYTWKTASDAAISKQLFKETMRDGFVIVDAQNRVVDYNLAIADVLGGRVKVQNGVELFKVFPELETVLNQAKDRASDSPTPVYYKNQELSYEIIDSPVGRASGENAGRMYVFHNVTGRDALEEALRKKVEDVSRSNAFLSSLARLTLSFQNVNDPVVVMHTLGTELSQLGLTTFIALYNTDSTELSVRYFSERYEAMRLLEKAFGVNILGFHLDRKLFASLYQAIENRQIQYYADEQSGLSVFLGDLPGWVKDSLLQSPAVSRGESSMLLPLIAADRLIGVMGVWGKNLHETDIPTYQIFGSQVGWAIEKAILREADARRLEELSHANAMITALSKVSSQLEATSESTPSFEAMGVEFNKINLSCAIALLDGSKETGTLRYVSFPEETMQMVEQLLGVNLVGWRIPKQFWPSDRAVRQGEPDWFGNAQDVFKHLFTNYSVSVLKSIYQWMKISPESQLCFLPLKINGEVIGMMVIWGENLTPKDNLTLTIFSDQVAAIMRRNLSYENEVRKSVELSRLSSMVLALSGVASQLDSTTDIKQVLATLGKELKKVNLNCMVGTLDETKQTMKIEYLPFGEDMKQQVHKIGIPWPEEMKIPRRLWPTDKAVTARAPYWDPEPIGKAYRMFPFISKDIFNAAMRLVGIDMSDPVCYLPMISEEDVIGILSVWGKELRKEDIPALSIFANQVATALRNAQLYAKAQSEIIERTQAERRIRDALTEKEVLLKEVHHRVKNNLQVISSLLNLQAAEITDANTLSVLKESQNRVRTMALIHEKLYQSSDLAQIDFSAYLQSLVTYLAQSYRVKADQVSIQVQAEKILLDLDTAIPCGLIVNELVSNSIKYAYPDGTRGTIRISCSQRHDKRYSLKISDDGVGLPAGFDYTRSSSLGLKLVNNLVSQIDGELAVDSKNGSRFEIIFCEETK